MTRQLAISLESTKVNKLVIQKDTNLSENMNLSFGVLYNDEDLKSFSLIFNLIIVHKDGVSFDVEYSSLFKTDHEIDEEFKSSFFPVINAPAIAYPFLRSYLAGLMTISGYSPIILPTINFSEAYETNKLSE